MALMLVAAFKRVCCQSVVARARSSPARYVAATLLVVRRHLALRGLHSSDAAATRVAGVITIAAGIMKKTAGNSFNLSIPSPLRPLTNKKLQPIKPLVRREAGNYRQVFHTLSTVRLGDLVILRVSRRPTVK